MKHPIPTLCAFVLPFVLVAQSGAQLRLAQEDIVRPVTLPTHATTNWPTAEGGTVPAAPQLSWGIHPVDDFGNRPVGGFSRIDIIVVERDAMAASSPVPFLITRRGDNRNFMAHPYDISGGTEGTATVASNQWFVAWYRLRPDTNGVRTVTARKIAAYTPAEVRAASWSVPRVETGTGDLGARIPAGEVHFIRWAWMTGVPDKFTACAMAVGDSAVFPDDDNAAGWYARETAAKMITPRKIQSPNKKQNGQSGVPVMYALCLSPEIPILP